MRTAVLIFAVLISLPGLHAFAPPPSPWDVGARQAKEGNCTAAVQTLTSALASAPAPTAAPYLSLFDCYAAMKNAAEAEQILRKGLVAHPANPALEMALGELLMDLQSTSVEAGKLLEDAVRLTPRDPEARNSYAQWAHMNWRDRTCVEQEKAALLLPGLSDDALVPINTLLGTCSSGIEDAAGARTAFQKANMVNLRRKTYDPDAAWQYVEFLKRYGEDAEVQQIVRQILDRVPDYAQAREERARGNQSHQ